MTTPAPTTTRTRRSIGAAVGVVTCLGVAVTPALALPTSGGNDRAAASSAGGSSYRVLASGLDNPRQLAFDRHGDLYVAESGHGGAGPCVPSADDPDLDTCFGTSGAITRIHHGRARRVVTGLPSLAPQEAAQGGQLPPGAEAAGPSDVTTMGRRGLAFTVGFGSNPANRMAFSAVSSVGHLLSTVDTARVSPHWWYRQPGSTVSQRGDLAAFEAVNNPVPPEDAPDSNANAVIRDGRGFVAVDAGGNDLLRVSASGRVSLITTFPSAKACTDPASNTSVTPQAVPTSVVRGPDHAYYVSELTGYPFCEGEAVIWKVKHGHANVYASGLTNVTDLAFGRHGRLYAVEIAEHGLLNGPMGAVVAIPRGGGDRHRVVAGGLFAPYGIALRHGSAYVTTGSILPTSAHPGGQVIRIPLHR